MNVVSNDGAPGGGISIQIRGTNSFQGSTEPLYVIDGVPIADSNDDTINFDSSSPTYNNALSSLNPSDIASIEILKDASSTAIYGSRGVNGVVLITTKSGTGLDVKDQISFSYKTTISNPVKKIKVLGARDYATYRNQSYINTQEVSISLGNKPTCLSPELRMQKALICKDLTTSVTIRTIGKIRFSVQE